MSDLTVVSFNDGNSLVVDSRLVAESLQIEHESFVRTINTYQLQVEEAFGQIIFQSHRSGGRGKPERYALLNEDQATFLLTLSRNTPEVVTAKLKLVQAFSRAKDALRRKQDTRGDRYIPYWYKRMRLAMSDSDKPLPDDCFCIYLEMMNFFSKLEVRLNYIFPDISPTTNQRMIADISIGKGFNRFLRSDDEIAIQARQEFLKSSDVVDFREGGSHFDEIEFYNHVYPEESHGKEPKPARAYPIKYLSIFRYYLEQHWIPDNCFAYIAPRDPEGVEYIRSAISQLPPTELENLQGTSLGRLIQSLPPST